MEKLHIKETYQTPTINFDPDKGIFEIKGRSIDYNIMNFFQPLLDYINRYSKAPHQKTVMKMMFTYYNTGTSICILDIFNKLDDLYKKGLDVKIQWYYDKGDDSYKEDGEDFRDYVSVPFEVIESA